MTLSLKVTAFAAAAFAVRSNDAPVTVLLKVMPLALLDKVREAARVTALP